MIITAFTVILIIDLMNTHTKYCPRTDVDWDEIKIESLKYCTGYYGGGRLLKEEDVIIEFRPLWNSLKRVNYNINQFFSQKLYLDIPDDGLIEYILIVCLMAVKPMSDFVVDWLNGYLDFDFINPNIAAGAEWKPTDEIDILEYLWYCRKDEDIWWMFGQGIGNIKDMFEWYMGDKTTPDWFMDQRPPCYFIKDVNKALDMVLYLEHTFGETNKAVADTIKMIYKPHNNENR